MSFQVMIQKISLDPSANFKNHKAVWAEKAEEGGYQTRKSIRALTVHSPSDINGLSSSTNKAHWSGVSMTTWQREGRQEKTEPKQVSLRIFPRPTLNPRCPQRIVLHTWKDTVKCRNMRTRTWAKTCTASYK